MDLGMSLNCLFYFFIFILLALNHNKEPTQKAVDKRLFGSSLLRGQDSKELPEGIASSLAPLARRNSVGRFSPHHTEQT